VKPEELLRRLGPQRTPPPLRREHTALLVVDMQEYFRGMVTPILPALVDLIRHCRDSKVPILYTQHSHPNHNEAGMLGQWWGDLILQNSPEAELLPETCPLSDDIVIPKTRYSAFYKTDLDQKLRDQDITDLVIGGVMTNLCCETTARDAFVRDYRIFFLIDGTATTSNEYQLAALRNLSFGFAYLVTCRQIYEQLLSLSPDG
jgi:isochorismate hydrolase